MKFSVYNISFNYKLLPSLAFIIFFIFFIKLGFWQLDRADQKKIINMAFVERQNQSPIQLNKETIQMPIKDIIWHRVSMRGEFLNDKDVIALVLLNMYLYVEKYTLVDGVVSNSPKAFPVAVFFVTAFA